MSWVAEVPATALFLAFKTARQMCLVFAVRERAGEFLALVKEIVLVSTFAQVHAIFSERDWVLSELFQTDVRLRIRVLRVYLRDLAGC